MDGCVLEDQPEFGLVCCTDEIHGHPVMQTEFAQNELIKNRHIYVVVFNVMKLYIYIYDLGYGVFEVVTM